MRYGHDMAGRRRRGKRSQVDWMPIEDELVVGAVAADAEVTLVDSEIEHKGTGVAYSSGALVGLRAWIQCVPQVLIDTAPHVHCMLLPAGLAIPGTGTEADKKNVEKFFWWQGMMRPSGASGITAGFMFFMEVQIKTARRFDQSDRLLIRLHNTDENTAFGATARAAALIDVYVRED